MLSRIWIIVVCIIIASCKDNTVSVVKNNSNTKDQLLALNAQFANAEAKFISTMVDSLKLPAQQDSLGYWYWIYENGFNQGPNAGFKDQVKIRYTLCLLEGDTVNSAAHRVEKTFVVGMSEIESGLHHAVKHLRVGDKAKIILPSHLAFGTYGDGGSIPSKASLLYDLELIQIQSE